MSDDRPDLVLLHGFLGSPDDWDSVAATLEPTWRCTRPDLTQHRGLERLHAAIRARTSGGAIVAGYSMGARLALHLVARHPESYRGAVLASGSPGVEDDLTRERRRAGDAELAARLRSLRSTNRLRAFLAEWYANPIFADVDRHACFPAMLARRLRIDARVWASTLEVFGVGVLPDLWREIDLLQRAVLFVAGGRDTKYVAIAKEATRRNSRLRYAVVADCGHAMLCEKPDEFATQVANFLVESVTA